MSHTSHGIPLDNGDRADLPRCPMERLADRFMDVPCPRMVKRYATRDVDGFCHFELEGWLAHPDQVEDLINYLARVKG